MLRYLVLVTALLPAWSAVAAAEENPETTTPVLVGKAQTYTPPLRVEKRGLLIEAPLLVGGRLEGVSSFPVDRQLSPLEQLNVGNLQARIAIRFNTRRAILPFNVGLEYEHDIVTGPLNDPPKVAGAELLSSEDRGPQLRKGFGRVSLGYYLHVIGGFNVSHWGMGLLANDGAHGWSPGSARFADPRGGDRVLRVALATGPVGRLAIQAAVGFDWVQSDDALLQGDSASQLIAAFTLGAERPSSVGIYGVWRRQEDLTGAKTQVGVIDLYARHAQPLRGNLLLRGELEGALISGTTQLGASAFFPDKRVLQLGVAARAALEARRAGAVLDILYASGDADVDDNQQNAFKPDPNFDMGLLLFRQVLAGQTARSVYTASDPNLVGRPAEGLERIPTRGSASNTVSFFPRFFWRPATGLELYGGPLIAIAASRFTDPRNTRLAGGTPRNALDRTPGSYYGTELDLGTRYQALLAGMLLTVGAEAGVLFPGAALAGENGTMGAVYGGRLLCSYRF